MQTLDPSAGPLAVLVNPVAGKGRAARALVPVAERLTEAGYQVQVLVGDDADDAERRARAAVADGVQALLVLGGDGIVHIGTNATASTGTPLGVLPAGTGNDFARMVGLEPADPAVMVDRLLAGSFRDVDAGRAGDRWFGCVLAAGFDSMVNERANTMRWPKGRARYNLAMLAELGVFRPLTFDLTVDGVRQEREAMLVAVGNGASYGGGMRVCPGARLDDGRFHVTILKRISKVELLRVFPRVYKGTHVTHPAVEVIEAVEISLAAPGVVAYADGERIRPLPLTCRTVPGALRVVSPLLA